MRELIHHGHQVVVETDAGAGIGFDDDSYRAVGAEVLGSAEEVFAAADMIVKVKEPQASEYGLLRDGQILYTYLHLAPDLPQTQGLIESGCIAIAYETVTNARGGLPLLAPMSEVAGRMSVQVGAHCLEKEQGGSGMLLGGVPGVAAAKVVIIGGGVSGTNAARMAMGMEAHVTVIDRSLEQLYALDLQFGPMLNTIYSTVDAIETHVTGADLVIGAVLVPGAAAPKLVTRDMVSRMRPGSVLVDIAIDQGGCFETSKPTTHSDPTYVVDDCVHYCVTNMPGAVCAHLDDRAEQRHPAVRPGARQQGLQAGADGQPAPAQRPQRGRRQGDLSGRGRSPRAGLHPGGGPARGLTRRRFGRRMCDTKNV